jgi:MFS family permease
VLLAAVLALSSADTATVGASATQLRASLHIDNTDIGLLVAVNSAVAAVFSIPCGFLADRVRRTRLLGGSVFLWGIAMLFSATAGSFDRLLLTRLALGVVTAAAGPVVASLIGDYFPSSERGRIYGFVLSGELLGAGIGFAVSGDIAALSWRLAFVILALPTFVLARLLLRLPEPVRGGRSPLLPDGHPGLDPNLGPHEDDGHVVTDAQRLARDRGVRVDQERVDAMSRRMGLVATLRLLLSIKTNTVLILASAFGYFYLAGVETFAVEFTKDQYGINQALANLLLLVLGAGAIVGVLASGPLSDRLLRRGRINARIGTTAIMAALATVLFIPALLTRNVATALPYLTVAAFALAAQNPPIDAARLDIVPAAMWGRAEGLRTALRTAAQSLAPLLFGGLADLGGGGRSGLQLAFLIMLLPLGANAWMLRGAGAVQVGVGSVARLRFFRNPSGPWRARPRRRPPSARFPRPSPTPADLPHPDPGPHRPQPPQPAQPPQPVTQRWCRHHRRATAGR